MNAKKQIFHWKMELKAAREAEWLKPYKLDLIAGLSAGWVSRNERVGGNIGLAMFMKWADALGYELKLVKKSSEARTPDLNICPGCGGPADNGHDRGDPPTTYYCSKCNRTKETSPERSYIAQVVTKTAKEIAEEFPNTDTSAQHTRGKADD